MKRFFLNIQNLKLSNNVSVIYSKNQKILTFFKNKKARSLKLPFQIFLLKSKNLMKISSLHFQVSIKKKLTSERVNFVQLVKQSILEISVSFCVKLKLVGIGYRVFNVNELRNQLIMLKLGFSHFFYFKISSCVKIYCSNTTKLFIFGNLYSNLMQTASLIKSYKKTNVYKGKGIFYNLEKIKLKQIKKN